MPKLVDLEARFLIFRDRGSYLLTDDMKASHGVIFLCPKCFAANNGNVGTHMVLCWFKDHNVPDDAYPGPGRWTAEGTGLHDLTLSPSIDLSTISDDNPADPSRCYWHGYIANGVAR